MIFFREALRATKAKAAEAKPSTVEGSSGDAAPTNTTTTTAASQQPTDESVAAAAVGKVSTNELEDISETIEDIANFIDDTDPDKAGGTVDTAGDSNTISDATKVPTSEHFSDLQVILEKKLFCKILYSLTYRYLSYYFRGIMVLWRVNH